MSTNNFTPIVQVRSFLTEYVTKVVYSVCSKPGAGCPKHGYRYPLVKKYGNLYVPMVVNAG